MPGELVDPLLERVDQDLGLAPPLAGGHAIHHLEALLAASLDHLALLGAGRCLALVVVAGTFACVGRSEKNRNATKAEKVAPESFQGLPQKIEKV